MSAFNVVMLGTVCALSLAVGISMRAEATPTEYVPSKLTVVTMSADARPVAVQFKDSAEPIIIVESPNAQPDMRLADEQMLAQTTDEFILAATMWGEARSEGRVGMGYVGHVIKNRADANFRGSTVKKVALRHKQFSCWNRNDPNRKLLTKEYLENTTGIERQRWEEAKYLAYYIVRGSKDYTNGALHYHTKAINPKWSGDYEVAKVRGSHVFYR